MNILAFGANQSSFEVLDSTRAMLNIIQDKSSQDYIKNRQKLQREISRNKLDYSYEARFNDISRLLSQSKIDAAIYELKDLIGQNYKASECYEILGDIAYTINKQNGIKRSANYYKKSLNVNNGNYSARFKLARLYFQSEKNILGIENLKEIIMSTNNFSLLSEAEKIILKEVKPQNRLESNNLFELLGFIYIKTNREVEAYRALHRALAFNPSDIFIKYYLGDLYYKNNKQDYALKVYQSIIDENNDTQIRLSKAKILLNLEDKKDAQEEYLKVLEKYPKSAQAKYGLYKVYENEDEPNILIKLNKETKNYIPSKEDYLTFAQFLLDMEDEKGAKRFKDYILYLDKQEELKRIEELKYQEQQRILKELQEQKQAELEQKKIQEQERLKEEKRKKLENSKKITGKNKKPIQKTTLNQQNKTKATKNEIGNKIQEQNKNKEFEAKKSESERLKFAQKNPQKYKQLNEVVQQYLKQQNKTAETYNAIANTYRQMEMPTTALNYYKQAMKLDATNSDIYFNIGLTYLELNNTQNAKEYLIKSINLNSNNTKAVNLLGFVNQKIVTNILNNSYNQFEAKNYLGAIETLDNGIKKYPNNQQLYYYRALALEKIKRNAAAIIDLQKAINLNPSYYIAYYQLGKMYEKINNEKSALVAYERFLSSEPEEKELVKEVQEKVINLGKKYY